MLVAVPLGILATRYAPLERVVMGIGNVIQTIPSLALLALFIPLGLGIGNKPAVVALFPVSYTHLDVYKRQVSMSSRLKIARKMGSPAVPVGSPASLAKRMSRSGSTR